MILRRLHKYIAAVAVAAAALLPAGCTPQPEAYSEYATLGKDGWAYEDTLVFVPQIPPAVEGRLSVGLRHNGDYPYRNLWLEVTTPIDSTHARRDTLSVELADKFGRWKGTGIGALRQYEITVARHVRVDSGARVLVRHIMRLDTLPDIEQVGIFIEPAE